VTPFHVLAGAPGAGKTTVLVELEHRGYATVPDAARAVIRARKSLGLPPRPAAEAFARAVLDMDIQQYHSADREATTFFDRGIVDSLAGLKAAGNLTEAALDNFLEQFPYSRDVFLFDAWKGIYRQDSERDHSFEHAQAVARSTRNWYTACGFTVVEVPKMDVVARADFVLAHIGETLMGVPKPPGA
jgi:predicted ATPase